MSLAIDINKVTHVLLADGWHKVRDNSFLLDSYEFISGKPSNFNIEHGGGDSDICAVGFYFLSDRCEIFGPLTSILAVKTALSDE